jgi:hypothetical protein
MPQRPQNCFFYNYRDGYAFKIYDAKRRHVQARSAFDITIIDTAWYTIVDFHVYSYCL